MWNSSTAIPCWLRSTEYLLLSRSNRRHGCWQRTAVSKHWCWTTMPCEASMMQTLDSSKSCTAQFADQHIHGLAGVDFATSTTSDIRAALALLAARRTTQVTASIPIVQQHQVPAILARLCTQFLEWLLSGIHFEGLFLSLAYTDAHSRQALLAFG